MDVLMSSPVSELGSETYPSSPSGGDSIGPAGMTILEILKAAREVYAARGGYKGAFTGEDGTVCAVGAARAITGNTVSLDLIWASLDAVAPGGYVSAYNDDLSTTKADILRLYDNAIHFEEDRIAHGEAL